MKIFAELAAHVESEWRKQNHDLNHFSELATQALADFSYSWTSAQLDKALSQWLTETSPLPEQINLHNTFGQPPITVFNNGRFVVDIYIWVNFDTSIHSHGFRGAFRVLHGHSLQEIFTVKTVQKVSEDVLLTDLGTPETTLLNAGDVRTIGPGGDLTHRVIHLENPTVTLCVKTINEPELFQWHHFLNGLAIQKRHIRPALVKQIYFFQYLQGRNPREALTYLNELLAQLDTSTQMNLGEEISGGAYDLKEDCAQFILERIYERHSASEWFKRYESANLLHASELDFSSSDSPLQRATAHLINSGWPKSDAQNILAKLTGHPLSPGELKSLILSTLEIRGVFQYELNEEELQTIAELLRHPHRPTPEEFAPLEQIQKLRAALRSVSN